jgi:hypothetical protein
MKTAISRGFVCCNPVLPALRDVKYHFRGAYNPRGLADRSSKAHDLYEFA